MGYRLKTAIVAASIQFGLLSQALVTPASAQDTLVLDDILISAGRTPVSSSETGRAFTVITGEQLEARGTRYVSDALRLVPGVAVSRTGSVGSLTAVRIRGGETSEVLVLIDGVELNPAATGEFDFGSLQVADIERIEILRGPQSALYGSNAASGVISIITNRGERNSFTAGAATEVGTDGTAMVSGYTRGGGARWDGSISASYRQTEGFNVATGTDDRDGERDGDENLTFNFKGNADLTDTLSAGTTLRIVDRESESDNQLFPFPADATSGLVADSDSVNDARDISFSVFGRHLSFDDALENELKFEYSDNKADSRQNGASSFLSESTRASGTAQSSLFFNAFEADNVVTAAVEVEEEVNEASTGDQTRTLVGLIGEYRTTLFDRLSVQGGVRYDFNDEFEDAFTFSLGSSYQLLETNTRIHASVGRGVVNPTFIEQFGFFPSSFVGNPDLEPEQTFQWDVGVEQRFLNDRLIADVTYFRGETTDEIVSAFDATVGLPTVENASGESPRQGVEFQLSAIPMERIFLTASYTYTLSEEGDDGLQEVRRPRHQASFDANYTFLGGQADLNLGISYTGDQRDLDFSNGFSSVPRITLDQYVLVSLQGRYRITEQAEIFARVENLTDSDYQEVLNYETQGITGFAGVRATF